ncbi:MAG TPA: hypothetical protein VFB25_11610 [Gaiellaceae bacterium]|nr:hypothetical protein [Gaiellaceae bacterium]
MLGRAAWLLPSAIAIAAAYDGYCAVTSRTAGSVDAIGFVAAAIALLVLVVCVFSGHGARAVFASVPAIALLATAWLFTDDPYYAPQKVRYGHDVPVGWWVLVAVAVAAGFGLIPVSRRAPRAAAIGSIVVCIALFMVAFGAGAH